MKNKINEISKICIILLILVNIPIILIELRYIEFIYIIIFLFLNLYVVDVIDGSKKEINTYVRIKKIVNSKKILFIGTNILIFFYIFKEPYFFLSKYKILILLGSIILGYSSLIFIQKIKIKLLLNFFKEIIKIFLVSAIIYYFPIVCINIFWLFVKFVK